MEPMIAIPVVLAFLCMQSAGSISGTATDSVTGEALSGVQVHGTSDAAYTDDRGNFTLPNLPAGRYLLQGMRDGYSVTKGTPVTLEANEAVAGLKIKMRPLGVIAGTVRDPDGAPLAGAAIELLRREYEYARPAVRNWKSDSKTNDLGQYQIAGVEPGKYYVRVAGSPVTGPVDIAPGVHAAGIDIQLQRSAGFHVTVQTGGAAIGEMHLSSNPEMELLGLRFQGSKNQDGDFEFSDVPEGLYTMTADGVRLTALRVMRDMFTRIAPQPRGHVGFHVVGMDKPVTALLHGAPDPDRAYIYLQGLPSDLVIKSMRSGGTDVYGDGVTVSGADDIDVEIVLAAEGGTVDGKVAGGATVLLVAAPELRGRYDSFHAVTADQHGRFHFTNIRPGEYKLFTWDDVEENAWFDPEFLKKFEDQGVPLTIAPGGHVTSQLHLPLGHVQ
jgi:protocatechuate 3,4-dioxygenase beta subunit